MSEERLKILIENLIKLLDTELMEPLILEEKINILKKEIGFTDEEIKELNIVEECLKIF